MRRSMPRGFGGHVTSKRAPWRELPKDPYDVAGLVARVLNEWNDISTRLAALEKRQEGRAARIGRPAVESREQAKRKRMRWSVLMARIGRFPPEMGIDELPNDLREGVGEAWRRGAGEAIERLAANPRSRAIGQYRKRLKEIRTVVEPILRLIPKKKVNAPLAREDDKALMKVFVALKGMFTQLRKEAKTEDAFRERLSDRKVLKGLIDFCEAHVDVFDLSNKFEPDEWLSPRLLRQIPNVCPDARVALAVGNLLNFLVDADVVTALFGGGGVVKAAKFVTSRMSGFSIGNIERITHDPGY